MTPNQPTMNDSQPSPEVRRDKNSLTDEEIERGLELAQKATPAPWCCRYHQDKGFHRIVHNLRQDWPDRPVCWIGWNQARRDADAEFVAAFRDLGPRALHELVRAREALLLGIQNCTECSGRGGYFDGDESGPGEWVDCDDCKPFREVLPDWGRRLADAEDERFAERRQALAPSAGAASEPQTVHLWLSWRRGTACGAAIASGEGSAVRNELVTCPPCLAAKEVA